MSLREGVVNSQQVAVQAISFADPSSTNRKGYDSMVFTPCGCVFLGPGLGVGQCVDVSRDQIYEMESRQNLLNVRKSFV